jgi:GNAT superfamily N-acetyltransferase
MSLEVRPALAGEVERVLGMYEWLFEEPGYVPPDWDPERARRALARTLSSDESIALLAEDGAELVGFATCYLDLDSVRFGLRCWVEDLAVSPERRSDGIGGALLDAAEAWARERGATHLELDTGFAREDAQRFYKRREPAAKGFSYSWRL